MVPWLMATVLVSPSASLTVRVPLRCSSILPVRGMMGMAAALPAATLEGMLSVFSQSKPSAEMVTAFSPADTFRMVCEKPVPGKVMVLSLTAKVPPWPPGVSP